LLFPPRDGSGFLRESSSELRFHVLRHMAWLMPGRPARPRPNWLVALGTRPPGRADLPACKHRPGPGLAAKRRGWPRASLW